MFDFVINPFVQAFELIFEIIDFFISNTGYSLLIFSFVVSILIHPIENESIVINKYYKLNVYRHLEPSKKYIITTDPAKGKGGNADRTAITVIDAHTKECCAIFKSNTIQ